MKATIAAEGWCVRRFYVCIWFVGRAVTKIYLNGIAVSSLVEYIVSGKFEYNSEESYKILRKGPHGLKCI